MIRTAATVTMDDLVKFFAGGKHSEGDWAVRRTSQFLEASSESTDVSIEAKGFVYHVIVEAREDPSDADEAVTDEPLKFLAEFLSTGTAGDEVFRKMSSSPAVVSGALKLLARRIEKGISGPRRTAAELRRTVVALLRTSQDEPELEGFPDPNAGRNDPGPTGEAPEVKRGALEKEELAELMAEIKRKGWKVKEADDDRGLPFLAIDIGDEYRAKISVDHILWEHTFEVRGQPETKEHGQSDDPIAQYRNWGRDEDIREAKKKSSKRGKNEDSEPPDTSSPTKAPKSGPGSGEGDPTRPPPNKKNEEETKRPPSSRQDAPTKPPSRK